MAKEREKTFYEGRKEKGLLGGKRQEKWKGVHPPQTRSKKGFCRPQVDQLSEMDVQREPEGCMGNNQC